MAAVICVGVSVAGYAAIESASNAKPTSATAPETSATLEEIVVTATRQEEPLSRVPLSIVALGRETLDKQGVRSIDDVARLTPGVTFARGAINSSQSNISIRGIRSTSGIPTTGIYIDDTPVQTRVGTSQSLTNPYPQIFDLERIEVLRGPQGTLFGTGSVGGAVRFISPEPNLRASDLYARTEVGSTDHGGLSYEAGVAGGAPLLTDTLGFRASIWHRHEGGYVDRLDRVTKARTAEDINSGDSYAGRLALGWKPNDALTITPSVFFQRTTADDSPMYEVATSDPAANKFNNGITAIPQTSLDRFTLPALKVELTLGSATLISNTSYLDRKNHNFSDDSSTSLQTFAGYSGPVPAGLEDYRSSTQYFNTQHVLTQELRVQNNDREVRLNWVAGVFYSRTRINDAFGSADPDLLRVINFGQSLAGQPAVSAVADLYGVNLYQGQYSLLLRTHYEDTQKSVFAQTDYRLTDALKLTAGLRYTDAKFRSNTFVAGPLLFTDGRTQDLASDSSPVTPKVGLAYQANRDNLFYANIAKGFRIGGAAAPVGPRCATDAAAIGFDPLVARVIDPDSVWSYELGSKNKLLDQRLTVDAAVYRINWSNVQTSLYLPLCQIPTTLNVGDARSDGVDLALSALPMSNLSLGASVSYIDSRYTSDLPGPGGTIIRKRGEPLDVAPWSFYLNGQIDFMVHELSSYVRADFSHSTHNNTPLDTSSPLTDPAIPRLAATTSLDLRAGLRLGGVDVSVFVSNALNDHPQLALYHDAAGAGNFRAVSYRPRTIGLTAMIRK